MKKSECFFFYQEHNQKIAEKKGLELTATKLSVILQTVVWSEALRGKRNRRNVLVPQENAN